MSDDTRIIRTRRRQNFLVLGNEVAEDSSISYKASGLLVSLLAKPDDWQSRVSAMLRPTDRRDAVRAALRELRLRGYVSLVTFRDVKGRISRAYYVFDRPDGNNLPDPLRPEPGCPEPENPALGFQPVCPEAAFLQPDKPEPEKASIYKEPSNQIPKAHKSKAAAAAPADALAARAPEAAVAAENLVKKGVSPRLVERATADRLVAVAARLDQPKVDDPAKLGCWLLEHPDEEIVVGKAKPTSPWHCEQVWQRAYLARPAEAIEAYLRRRADRETNPNTQALIRKVIARTYWPPQWLVVEACEAVPSTG